MKAKNKVRGILTELFYGLWDLAEALAFIALIGGLAVTFLCKNIAGFALLFLSVLLGLLLVGLDCYEKKKYERATAPQRSNVIDRETICRIMTEARKKEEKSKKKSRQGAGTPGGKG